MKFSNLRKGRPQGFTLPELMVAMTITLVLVLLTLLITGTAIDTWKAARTEIRAAGQAKVMLNAMGRDLESFVSRMGNNNTQWLIARTTPQGVGPQGQETPNAARLTFFTAASDRYNGNAGSREKIQGGGANRNADQGGDISVVSYELDFVDPVFGNPNQRFSTFVMYRNLLDPDDTYNGAVIGLNDRVQEDLEQRFDSRAGDADLTDLICENVYELTITFVIEFRDVDGNNQIIKVPVMTTNQGQQTVRSFAVNGSGLAPNEQSNSEYSGGRIVSVELGITVLTDEGVSVLKRNPFRNQIESTRFIENNSFRYTRSVAIPQG